MADDPLYAPLGVEAAGQTRARRRGPARLAAVSLLLAVAGLAAVLFLSRAPSQTGDPVAVATIQTALPRAADTAPATPAPIVPQAAPAPPPGSTVEVQNGVKIVRLNPSGSASPVTLPVDSGPAAPLAAAPDPRVSETTPDGVLPRVGKDGSRPSAVYAGPAPEATGPRVALIALGVGQDQLGSAEAARALPVAIDFAYAPDAPDIRTQVAEVRRAGREVLLDLGANASPGLRPALGHWSGYVGVRVPAEGDAAMREALARGLLVVEAGSVDAVADGLAGAADAGSIGSASFRLATVAREKGRAVGLVHNAIAARDVLARAAAELAAQGILLVPLSALASAPANTAAR